MPTSKELFKLADDLAHIDTNQSKHCMAEAVKVQHEEAAVRMRLKFFKTTDLRIVKEELDRQRQKVAYEDNVLEVRGPGMLPEEYVSEKNRVVEERKKLRGMTKEAGKIVKESMK